MRDVGRWYGRAVDPTTQRDCVIAWMLGEQPVGTAPTDRIELDALQNAPAIGEIAGAGCIQQIGLDDLQLQGDNETVARPARAAPKQNLAGLDQLAARKRLQTVAVELAVGVALSRPGFP